MDLPARNRSTMIDVYVIENTDRSKTSKLQVATSPKLEAMTYPLFITNEAKTILN